MRSKRAETMRPKRGEIWLVSLNPTLGAELQKTRPVVVVSADTLGVLPIKLIVPFTGWSERYSGKLWLVRVDPTAKNGLSKSSAADALQTRSVSVERFISRTGVLEPQALQRIAQSLAVLVAA